MNNCSRDHTFMPSDSFMDNPTAERKDTEVESMGMGTDGYGWVWMGIDGY